MRARIDRSRAPLKLIWVRQVSFWGVERYVAYVHSMRISVRRVWLAQNWYIDHHVGQLEEGDERLLFQRASEAMQHAEKLAQMQLEDAVSYLRGTDLGQGGLMQ